MIKNQIGMWTWVDPKHQINKLIINFLTTLCQLVTAKTYVSPLQRMNGPIWINECMTSARHVDLTWTCVVIPNLLIRLERSVVFTYRWIVSYSSVQSVFFPFFNKKIQKKVKKSSSHKEPLNQRRSPRNIRLVWMDPIPPANHRAPTRPLDTPIGQSSKWN